MTLASTQSPVVSPAGGRGWSNQPLHSADNLTTFMSLLFRNSGVLNVLEPEGPVHACTGMAFVSY